MKEKKPKKDIRADVKWFQETIGPNRKIHLRVIHWICDGVDSGPKLEKRSFFKKKDGTFSEMGTCKGLNKADLEFVVSNWEELKMFFQ